MVILIKVALVLFRCFGGFGYSLSVDKTETSYKGLSGFFLTLSYTSIPKYKYATASAGILLVAYVISYTYLITYEFSMSEGNFDSATIMYSIIVNDVFQVFSMAGLMILMLSGAKRLVNLVTCISKLSVPVFDRKGRNVRVRILVVVLFAGFVSGTTMVIVLRIFYLYRTLYVVAFLDLISVIILSIIEFAYCCLFWSMVVLLSDPYKLALIRIKSAYSLLEVKAVDKKQTNSLLKGIDGNFALHDACGDAQKFTKTISSSNDSCKAYHRRVSLDDNQSTSNRASDSDSNGAIHVSHLQVNLLEELRENYRIILSTHKGRRVLLSYCGPAICLLMLYTILTMILSGYYLTYSADMTASLLLLNLCSLLAAVSITVFFVLVPEKVNNHVSKK